MFLAASLSVGEKFSVGGVTTLLGLGMTFLVLALLIVFILLIGFVLKRMGKINFKSKKKAPVVEKPVEEASTKEERIDEETMLAVTAAVETYVRESATDGKPHDKIKIKSVVRK